MSADSATDTVPKRLGTTAARGALVVMSGQLCKIAIQFGSIVILARLLSPDDYGLMAMIMVVVGLGDVLREFGLSSAAIQARDVSPQQRTNLFWINSAVGLLLAAAIIALSPAIAAFYDQPALQSIAVAMSLTFIFSGLATQFRAQLNREMRFNRLMTAEIAGMAAGLGIGVSMALADQGYLALVGQQIGQHGVTLVAMVIAGRWWPGLPRRGAGMAPFLRYGWNVMNTQLIGYAARNVDSLIIGRQFGAELLGLYNRAYQLLMLPLNQINAPSTTIALPVLSRLQNQPERYDAFLLHGQSTMLHLLVGGLAFGIAQAEPLILLVLGERWAATVPLFQALAVGGVFQAAGYASYWVFLSKGLTGSHLRFTLISRPLLILFIVLGAQWGVQGVAIAYSAGLCITWLWGLAWLRGSGAPVGGMLRNGLMIAIGYALCATASMLGSGWLGESLGGRLLAGLLAMLGAFLLLCLLWPAFRRSVVAVIETRKLLRAR
ncbi:lipopolysaccharide biosynthesis protein [Stutzerimonas tarimensis]|uniref:Lipopolysaccharide biosynthesis protein n=1 Tax=Stutzerimonas tarimensis TaxID=1507735 RepID=A0ABV7T558_9GAMM